MTNHKRDFHDHFHFLGFPGFSVPVGTLGWVGVGKVPAGCVDGGRIEIITIVV